MRSVLAYEPELLEQVRDGSTKALGELFTRYGEVVYQLAYRLMGSEADAADVLQDVFVGLPRAIGSYREQGQFLPWLRRLTARTALMRLRTMKRRREDRIENAGSIGWMQDDSAVERIVLRRALQKLPDSLRTAFVLKEIEGYSHSDVARFLGTTEAASMKRVSRAWKFLRKEVGER